MKARIHKAGVILFAMLLFACSAVKRQNAHFLVEHRVLQSKEFKIRIPSPFHLQIENYDEGVIYHYSFVDSVYIIVFQGYLMEFPIDKYSPHKTETTEFRKISVGIENEKYWRKDVIGNVRVYYNNATIQNKNIYDKILNNIEIISR